VVWFLSKRKAKTGTYIFDRGYQAPNSINTGTFKIAAQSALVKATTSRDFQRFVYSSNNLACL
jgi:hypothetical protein